MSVRRAAHRRGFTLIEILVVITIIAALTATAAIMIPLANEHQNRTVCARNLTDLGGAFLLWRQENPGRPPRSGGKLFLEWRQERRFLLEGDETKLLCPGDPLANFPRNLADAKRWDDVDLDDPEPGMCSYAGRNLSTHPLLRGSGRREAIAADRQGDDGMTQHHDGGLNVLYENGAVVFVTREALGLEAGTPIRVGIDAEVDLLRSLVPAEVATSR